MANINFFDLEVILLVIHVGNVHLHVVSGIKKGGNEHCESCERLKPWDRDGNWQ